MGVEREIGRLIEEKREAGAASLSEHDSLRVLRSWGIDVVGLALARSVDEAARHASRIGYPVVIKGIVPGVTHKTEKGLVHSWVRGEEGLREVIEGLPGECEGYLVEEQVRGIRELALGIVRDPTFGASVLVAMGGVHSELIGDASFALAPVGEEEALEALRRLRCFGMLGRYRGEEPARVDLLTGMMRKVGELAVALPQIKELDVNPVILRKDGTPVACSALVVL
jgi:succinyl-CoA synthetase beta subunit